MSSIGDNWFEKNAILVKKSKKKKKLHANLCKEDLVPKEDGKPMDFYIGYRLCEVGPFQNLIAKSFETRACLQL